MYDICVHINNILTDFVIYREVYEIDLGEKYGQTKSESQ